MDRPDAPRGGMRAGDDAGTARGPDPGDAADGLPPPGATARPGRFSAGAREELLGALRAARPAPAPAAPAPARSFDFTALPIHHAMRVQRQAAEALGVDMPFFRPQAERAGPEITLSGRRLLNFTAYDYLGFNGREEVQEAAREAILRYGVSVGASRVVAGERDLHRSLESRIARFLGAEAAVTFVSGHATNMAAIATLLGPRDLVLTDALIHNSIAEGARLSGAARVSFPHGDHAWVDDFLSRRRGEYERVLIAVEGLYSMDGDAPDLRGFVSVKRRRDAWLMVDEAHSLGTLGPTGRGIGEAAGVAAEEVEIWMGTLSKSLASTGGYIAGSTALVEIMKGAAPGFVFSVGLPAPLAAAADAALALLEAEPQTVARLQANGARMLEAARGAGFDTGAAQGHAILPVKTGSSVGAALLSDECWKRGLYALPITFPAVPEREARLRFFLTAAHAPEQIDDAVRICAEAQAAALARRADL
ncbi:aminotransferase class I/II-fold pyridoxal phosphate-dependent enzyme [Rhodovulum sp. DZ06]|uniref:aminotransferase class I/II-fold pyridoxal phosphate-dependent enzyme n=1 Tax=Rhodovulum sp. DZ06 TaxID=3425126 RepID=UPI003D3455AD